MDPRTGESRREIESFLDDVESYAGRKFSLRNDVALLLGSSQGREEAFAEIVFYAKFISKALTVLKRSTGEDVSRLEAEFGEKLGRTSTLIRTLLEGRAGDEPQKFIDRFLAPTRESMERFLELLSDLAWIKNYGLEKGRFPPTGAAM